MLYWDKTALAWCGLSIPNLVEIVEKNGYYPLLLSTSYVRLDRSGFYKQWLQRCTTKGAERVFRLGHYNRFTKTGCACGTFFQNRPFSLAEYFISKLGIFILGRSLFKEHTKGWILQGIVTWPREKCLLDTSKRDVQTLHSYKYGLG